mgnify:CR=1 FL=1
MEPPLRQIIEAIVFVSEKPVRADFLVELLAGNPDAAEGDDPEAPAGLLSDTEVLPADMAELSLEGVEEILEELVHKYSDETYPFTIRKVARGYQFFTKEGYYPWLRKAAIHRNQKRLTRTALETLSIIAYRQPITKSEVEFIRGVNCDYAVQKLLEKQLIAITGRSEGPGRPLLYSTSEFFMQYFGINDVSDLPKLKEFEDTAEQHIELFRQHQEAQTADATTGEDETEKKNTEALLGAEGGGRPDAGTPVEEN